MRLFYWLVSLFIRGKKVYSLHIPIGFQLSERNRLALFGGPSHFLEAHHERQ